MAALDGVTLAILGIGLLATVAITWYVYRDAQQNNVGRARVWAVVSAVIFLVGVWLYGVVGAPLSGSIITANTGLVLYGFEREVRNEDEPGTGPTGEPFRTE